jgi:hypothetical protein
MAHQMMLNFWMPLPPCRNELERVARRGHAARWGAIDSKRKWGNIAARAFLEAQNCESVEAWRAVNLPLAYAYILIDWHVKFTRDADNVVAAAKPVLDALTQKGGAGVIEDDNLKHLNLRHAFWDVTQYPGPNGAGECCHVWISEQPLITQSRFCPLPEARLIQSEVRKVTG